MFPLRLSCFFAEAWPHLSARSIITVTSCSRVSWYNKVGRCMYCATCIISCVHVWIAVKYVGACYQYKLDVFLCCFSLFREADRVFYALVVS